MQNLNDVENRVREAVRNMEIHPAEDPTQAAEVIAGDVAAQVYHYLIAVAHHEVRQMRI